LREYIDDTEDYINIQLDNHRNQLIQLELFLSSGTVCLSIYSLVAGIFGMNIPYTWNDEHGYIFKWVVPLLSNMVLVSYGVSYLGSSVRVGRGFPCHWAYIQLHSLHSCGMTSESFLAILVYGSLALWTCMMNELAGLSYIIAGPGCKAFLDSMKDGIEEFSTMLSKAEPVVANEVANLFPDFSEKMTQQRWKNFRA
ncbi:Magnesium transporter mrs2-like protein, partial [Thalictrum thalictroides]